jgi:chromate reductase, NAD(P)H dehydrogenase (quinone)
MMTEPRALQVLALPGSLRAGSYNRRLLEAAGELAPPGVSVDIYGLEALPLYNRDVEAAGDPPAVAHLKEAIAACDAVLIASPEYNAGTTGVLKNAIDWASRPPRESILGGKPVAVLGGGGRGGTRRAQAQVRAALEHPGARVLDEPEVAVARVRNKFDAEGKLTDDSVKDLIRALVANLVAEVRQDATASGAGSSQRLLAAA